MHKKSVDDAILHVRELTEKLMQPNMPMHSMAANAFTGLVLFETSNLQTTCGASR
jgi:hypothetical protein